MSSILNQMENKMKISIITPSFNQGKYIQDAIESVLNQKHKNFEHIIIDACSEDQTIEILKKISTFKMDFKTR